MAGRPRKNGATSITSEVVLGQASQNIKKAIGELNIVVDGVKQLDTKIDELTLQITNKEGELNDLNVQFEQKKKEFEVNLELDMKASTATVVNEFLSQNGKTSIPMQELRDLRSENEKLKTDYRKEMDAEIGKANGIAKSRFESELKLKEAEFTAKEAGNIAEIKSLTEKITWLETQSAKWETALAEERKTGVERAKAGSIGSVNLSAPGK